MTVFRDSFREVIKLNDVSRDGPYYNWCPYKKRKLEQNLRGRQCEEIGRRWPSTSQGERPANPAFMLILDF